LTAWIRGLTEAPILLGVVHRDELLNHAVGNGNVAVPATGPVPTGKTLSLLTEPGYVQLGDEAVGELVAVFVVGHGLAKGGVANPVPLEEFLDFLGVDHVDAFLGYDVHVDRDALEVVGPRAELFNADDGHDGVGFGFGCSFLRGVLRKAVKINSFGRGPSRQYIYTLHTQYAFDVLVLGLLPEIRRPGSKLTAEGTRSDGREAV
jgi:hypothetical protein